MSHAKAFRRQVCGILAAIALCLGASTIWAQEESDEDRQYREDYEKVQKIVTIADPVKRGEQLLAFLKDRPSPKLVEFAQGNFFLALDALLKQHRYAPMLSLAESFIKFRPRAGEPYFYYGAALKDQQKYPEAMDALAKCYVLKNPISGRAKEFLDVIYKGRNAGSLAGQDKIIKKAQAEAGK
jgi:tetratricopeptide (TPR) repeat protein